MNSFKKFAFLLIVLAFPLSGSAQKNPAAGTVAASASGSTATTQDLKLNSKLMAREMPYRVMLPKNYESEKSVKYAVIYLLHGLTGHFDNWTDRSKLKDYAAKYNYIIVTPEGSDGWYTDSATVANDKYESYIVRELIPEIDGKFRTLADREHRVIAGLSMGGYGSLKFGMKYPQMFVLVGSFSGALQAASLTAKIVGNSWKPLTDSLTSVYAADDSQTRKDNDIFKFAREITAEKTKELPFMYIDCGTEDGLIQANREFEAILLEKKIPHEFRQLPGKHDWVFWDLQIKEFLEVSEKFVK